MLPLAMAVPLPAGWQRLSNLIAKQRSRPGRTCDMDNAVSMYVCMHSFGSKLKLKIVFQWDRPLGT